MLTRWESDGRRLLGRQPRLRPAAGATITEIIAHYWPAVSGVKSRGHWLMLKRALRSWREHYGRHPAAEITPSLLREWRATVMREVSADAARRATAVVLGLFRWAVSHDLLPVEVYQRLRTIERLRLPARKRIGPAPETAVTAVCPLVSAWVRAMIDLQLATGMRPGEVCALRPCDISMGRKVWTYRPPSHKTAHRGHERIVYLGPRAQKIIRPFLKRRATTAPVFSPAEAVASWRAAKTAARKTPLSCGNRPGTNRKDQPRRQAGERYTTTAYCRAIGRACDRAGVARWHPHQLRHNYATAIRAKYGLEAARILLGHCSALVTEAVYAERDQQAAMRIAAEVG